MSIFDGIISDITPFADALGNSIGALTGSSKFTGASKADPNAANDVSLYRQERYANLLNSGVQRQSATPSPGEYKVTKSQADQTVDPEQLEQQWLRRLDTYSTVVSKSGVKGK